MSFKFGVKKKESTGEPAFDLEQQFIMRLPPGPAMALRREVENGSAALKDKFSIEIQPDYRHCIVRYGNDLFYGKLMDLPTIVESLKTIDKKTFYKTADICQMMICSTEEDNSQDENDSPKKKEKDKKTKYMYPHGVTAPLKNVRKRRFRKVLKKKYMEQPDIEKEVKRLFRTDAEAINVKWEIITEEEKPASESGNVTNTEASGSWNPPTSGTIQRTDTSASLDYGSLFGELSSSDEDDEKDINIMDSGEDEMSRGSLLRQSYGSLDASAGDTQDMMDTESEELQSKLTELKRQVEEIRRRRKSQEEKLEKLNNPMLQQRYQAILDQTIEEENEKEKEFEILSSMLTQS